ncbi:MAG: helicase, partial [Myxococcales bacterium]|nr:helicase [Myxococcales bacterium]
YWVCTVESMPVEREVDFLAVDEIQLAEHPGRGHVFTDRILHARGRRETWLLGADTMRPMLEQLVPTAVVQRHPRLSQLSLAGVHGLGALPPRSAVIAFSAAEVYELAERVRQRRGGAAVVMGALSPRARNAQVAMYQAGEVDFLVATDAVGMGLNMDVQHVAFAALSKFDGFRKRGLTPSELAQIAGRAGRYTQDGSFGTLAPQQIPSDIAFAIETHRFAPVRRVVWRNSDLDTRDVDALIASLAERPRRKVLLLQERASDAAVLRQLAKSPEIRGRARGREAVELLWDVCRIPDFRKLLVEHHASLLSEIYLQLTSGDGRIRADFMHERIGRLEDDQGDIDALLMRMEFIRTWSYVVHHAAWVHDALAWQERTRRAEDRLSEALHEALMERFVEGRGKRGGRVSRPRSRPRRSSPGEAAVEAVPDGPFAGLSALRDKIAPLLEEAPVDDWLEAVVGSEHERFAVDADGAIWLQLEGATPELVAKLARGSDRLHPEIKLTDDRPLGPGARARLTRRLRAFARDYVAETLVPLRDPRLVNGSPAVRGLAYQLEQGLGTAPARDARMQLAQLSRADEGLLDELGVVRGHRFVYTPRLGEADVARRAALCSAFAGAAVHLPSPGAPSLAPPRAGERESFLLLGYALLGPRLVRVDVVERVSQHLHALPSPFDLPEEIPEWLAAERDDAEAAVTALGYHRTADGFVRPRRRRRRRAR